MNMLCRTKWDLWPWYFRSLFHCLADKTELWNWDSGDTLGDEVLRTGSQAESLRNKEIAHKLPRWPEVHSSILNNHLNYVLSGMYLWLEGAIQHRVRLRAGCLLGSLPRCVPGLLAGAGSPMHALEPARTPVCCPCPAGDRCCCGDSGTQGTTNSNGCRNKWVVCC